MARQNEEPEYPTSEFELKEYCDRFIATLVNHLDKRVVCVLLNGSWAREEANPPSSDVDMTLIIDKMDETTSDQLCRVWTESNMGCVNVIDLVELETRPSELRAMLCDISKVLYGSNPFNPGKSDFAHNISNTASQIGLVARCAEYYHWQQVERSVDNLKYVMTSKYNLKWLLKNLVAFRTGIFPSNELQLSMQLQNQPEHELYNWSKELNDDDYRRKYRELARKLSICVHSWLKEVAAHVR